MKKIQKRRRHFRCVQSNNTQVEVDMYHDSVPFRLSSSNHIYSVDNYCGTIFRVLLKTYDVVTEYPLTPMGRSHVEILKIKKKDNLKLEKM